MDILNLVVEEESKNNPNKKNKLPDWVSDNNKSKAAYFEIEKCFEAKVAFIMRNSLESQFKGNKKSWIIKKTEVADALNSDVSTVFHNETFKAGINDYLKDKNSELTKKKNKRLKTNGVANKNKTQLVEEVKDYKKAYEALKQRKNKLLLRMMLEKMPLRDKKVLSLITK